MSSMPQGRDMLQPGSAQGLAASGISPGSASTASMPCTVRIRTLGPLAGMTTIGAWLVYSAVIRMAAMLVTASSRSRSGDPAGASSPVIASQVWTEVRTGMAATVRATAFTAGLRFRARR